MKKIWLYILCSTVFLALDAIPSDINAKVLKFQESGEFVWCGDKYLAISRHSRGADAGIRLLDVDHGHARQLTTTKTHRVVACTADGKHIFYVENGVDGSMYELDIENGSQNSIYTKNTFQHRAIEEYPISSSGDTLIGPTTLNDRIALSDRYVNVLHIPEAFSSSNVEGITWSKNGTLFLIVGAGFGEHMNTQQTLLIRKTGELNFKTVNLPSIKNARFRQIGWSEATNRLYMLAWSDGARLYEFDPNGPKRLRHLLARNVTELKAMPNGGLVYIQDEGADYSAPDSVAISDTSHRLLLMRTPQGELMELLKVPYKSIGISNIQISPSGMDVAVQVKKIDGLNNMMEIHVLKHIAK